MPNLWNSSSSTTTNSKAIWSKERAEIDDDLLEKFWSGLPLQARQELLRIDKQSLFEQVRKKLYCSRCNGLLLEGFTQIILYGKSLQQEDAGFNLPNRMGNSSKAHIDSEADDIQDPSVHPWGGLAATRDGILTLLDCFINSGSLKPLKKVFHSARAREHERELLYPDACGGESRGWSKGNGRENCALHTARLSCDTLIDFWSALGEETRTLLLRMKEEDFIERLMYRFDSKRFCRDCRRNVVREFKELKELKRMRRELHCTSWFCVADTAFQYEVSEDTVQADWHQSFADTAGKYHHFEWAIGTGEGKSDILEFEDVGMNVKVKVNGLDLGGCSACFITLRAWKLNGRCTEFCVKAHALNGQPCVHRRLLMGDGFVTITKGESIRSFFEHAEEAEEEEDDDSMDKDGNEIDGDGSRPQKHAKSPELAREFLLDAATVIFKEQVEKAFREGTARQNAHSIFVSLSLKLLEERVHVACKDIITLEKQVQLLEEEEREKREEEERRERRKAKEREKKLRRKERLKGKERDRENNHMDSPASVNDSSIPTIDSGDSVSEPEVIITPPDKDEHVSNEHVDTKSDEKCSVRDSNGSFTVEQSKSSRRKSRLKKEPFYHDESEHRPRIVSRSSHPKLQANRARDRYDYQSCGCSQNGGYRPKDAPKQLYRGGNTKQVWEPRTVPSQSEVKNVAAAASSDNALAEVKNACADPVVIRSSSSSDNCSSCLSEGDSSLGAQNTTESSSTSDSEDAVPNDTSQKQSVKAAPASDMTPIPVPVPVFSYHNPSLFPWQASHNGYAPFHQPNHFVYPTYTFWSSEFGMQSNPLFNNNSAYVANLNPKEKIKDVQQNGSSFSLFHYDGPWGGAAGFNKENKPAGAGITCAEGDTKIEEYSLFASGSGGRFSFF